MRGPAGLEFARRVFAHFDSSRRVRRSGDASCTTGETPGTCRAGKKLFADGSAPHSFKLSRSRVSPNGLIVGHYEREGEIKIGDTTLDSPSEREIARQDRMKREG